MKQNLTLTRNNDNDSIFRANAADNGKIRLDRISWYMPHVMPADKDKMELCKIIEGKKHFRLDIERYNVPMHQSLKQHHLPGIFQVANLPRYRVLS